MNTNLTTKMVSIIIPFYNAEKYIDVCIQTLQQQTFRNFEALFIDDGSTDETVNKIKRCGDERFKVLQQKHKGVSAARNLGLEHIKGDYIAFMDIDDEVEPEYLKQFVEDIEIKEVDIVLCNYVEVYTDKKRKIVELPWKNEIINKYDIQKKLLPQMISRDKENERIWGLVWRTFVRRSFYEKYKIQFDEEVAIAEDLLFLMELYSYVDEIYVEKRPLYLYHRNYNSALNKYSKDLFKNNMTFQQKLAEIVKKRNIDTNNGQRLNYCKKLVYTNEISNISRLSFESYKDAKKALRKLRSVYITEKLDIQDFEFSLSRKISLLMLKYRMYNILLLFYRAKEYFRLRIFIK